MVACAIHLLGLVLRSAIVAAQRENSVRTRRGRLSLRDTKLANNAADRYYAGMAGKEPMAQAYVAPKRERIRRHVDGKPTVPLEAAVNNDIYETFKHRSDVKLYRNNRGVAVYGNKQVAYGVGPKGGSDWIGYRRVFITAEMIGSFIAQFVALEAKRPGETADDNQQRFIDKVKADGGCAGVASSAEEALEVIS
jgi:hypothetical protein